MRTLKDAVYGVAVGDALGLPVQFMTRGTYYVAGMTGNGTYDMPAGTYSDDTAMTLAICDALKAGNPDSPDYVRNTIFRISCNFEDWLYEGKYTQDGKAYDVGGTTFRAIEAGEGQTGKYNSGNGSLMRTIPLAFTDFSDEDIAKVSALTHNTPLANNACVLYIRIARRLLKGQDIVRATLEEAADFPMFERLPELGFLERRDISSTGYVVDSLEAALWCLFHTDNYKDAILTAANLGDDTDTVAAIAGGLAGIMYGYEGIPKEWVKTLRKKATINSYLF